MKEEILHLYQEPAIGASYTNTYGEENIVIQKNKHKRLLFELKENINFTVHINYYDKYFHSKNVYLRHMIDNKTDTLEKINKINI